MEACSPASGTPPSRAPCERRAGGICGAFGRLQCFGICCGRHAVCAAALGRHVRDTAAAAAAARHGRNDPLCLLRPFAPCRSTGRVQYASPEEATMVCNALAVDPEVRQLLHCCRPVPLCAIASLPRHPSRRRTNPITHAALDPHLPHTYAQPALQQPSQPTLHLPLLPSLPALQLRPEAVSRELRVDGSALVMDFAAVDMRTLRAAVGTFCDLLGLATRTLEAFGPAATVAAAAAAEGQPAAAAAAGGPR